MTARVSSALGVGERNEALPSGEIVIVVPQLEPTSGMERAAIQLVRSLAPARRVKVVVLSGGVPSGLPEQVDVCLLRLPRRIHRLALAVFRLRRILRPVGDNGVIVAVGIWAAVPTLLAGDQRRIVVWEHSLSPWRLERDRRVRLLWRICRRNYRSARAIVAVSAPTRDCVATLTGRRDIVLIPNELPGSSADSIGPAPPSARRLACVSSLTPRKNVSLAIRALAHLASDIDLVIAGAGNQEEGLRAEATELGISGRVRFLGHVADGPAVMTSAAVVVHPAWDETFGFVLAEAAEVHRPVVVLDRPNMNRLVPEFAPGVVVPSATPAAFAKGIMEALDSTWRPEIFAAAASRRTEHFSSAVIARSWLGLLNAVVAEGSPVA